MTTPSNGILPPPKTIRFVNNQGQPPSKRRRINAACLTCRKRKTRCAGERPTCSTCRKNGHSCLGYNEIPDRKRESGARDERNGMGGVKREPDDDYLDEQVDYDYYDDKERRHLKVENGTKDISTEGKMSPPSRPSSTATITGRRRKSGDDWDTVTMRPSAQKGANPSRRPDYSRSVSFSEDSRSSHNRSPMQHQHHTETHRVPFFRYFGPTAIVPGYKQMLVRMPSWRSRRRSRGGSTSATSPSSVAEQRALLAGKSHQHSEPVFEGMEDLPVYDPNDSAPVHEIIMSLLKTFFLHLGSNYPFLREASFLRRVQEKRVEPILVDAMCALAARFSTLEILTDGDEKMDKSEYGLIFAQRAKSVVVDTFPCPSVSAVQACLLMAYEGFGANQDSALWMYLGLAIRMAVDVGLQTKFGVTYQGEKDAWYTKSWARKSDRDGDEDEGKPRLYDNDNDNANENENENENDILSPNEQHEVEQERIHTFWAVFVLDRVISSGTGRPVTFRDDDFELPLPESTIDPISGRHDPFPAFIQIIHLYGRVSDVLNGLRKAEDLTQEKMSKLLQMESELTRLYQRIDRRLHFDVTNFQEQVKAGQGTTFILLHFWFHALIIILHSPTLVLPFLSITRSHQLLPNSRELSMSSAKTIADILAFAELIDAKSLVGNPFTSQPMYIAACAFLMESVANCSQPVSRDTTPPPDLLHDVGRAGTSNAPSKHSLLASAASQNYIRCYKSLTELHKYWGGVKYILTALDQKSKGITDIQTYTDEEYESTKLRRGSLSRMPRLEHPASPNVPPIAFSLTGTTNSPNSNLTLLFQNNTCAVSQGPQLPPPPPPPPPQPVPAATPPGNMVYDPIRQSLPDPPPIPSPVYLQAKMSDERGSPIPGKSSRHPIPSSTSAATHGRSHIRNGSFNWEGEPSTPSTSDGRPPMVSGMPHCPRSNSASYTPNSHQSYESIGHEGSPSNTLADSAVHGQHHSGSTPSTHTMSGYAMSDYSQNPVTSAPLTYLGPGSGTAINEIMTLDTQEFDIESLGMPNIPNESMAPWLDFLPGDVLGLFDNGGFHGGAQNNMA